MESAPVQSYSGAGQSSPAAGHPSRSAPPPVHVPPMADAPTRVRTTPTDRSNKASAALSLDSNDDFNTSELLNLLYAFHNANTADEVVLVLQALFGWFQAQTFHPTLTPPEATGPFLPIQMLREAKNEFVQCAQIKQSRQPYVWTNVVAKQYAIILQHLLVAIQAQAQIRAPSATPPPHALQSQLNNSIHEAHAQYSKQQQSRQATPQHVMHSSASSLATPPVHAPSISVQAATPTNTTPRKLDFGPNSSTSSSSLVVKVPKKKALESKPKVVQATAPRPSGPISESPFFVDMTMRHATPGADDDHLYIPVRSINKVMKAALPKESKIKIAEDAKELMQECVTEFLLYLTSETRDQAIVNKRGKTTLTGSDALRALYNLGFTPYGDILGLYNDKIKVIQEEAAKVKVEKRAAKSQSTTTNGVLGSAPAADLVKTEHLIVPSSSTSSTSTPQL
ncbi:hypothetical protein SPRG_06164 [Saprolegnia parasitica CBS 223.65]|uniref:Transcription factor CBF/NF-Y/archaeal histone domain-containing protein n=1 Tax=Saprolegnia parasitica (strain CBS 223.65) TaxID=695850 RepID=A0A067CF40_SAPPC|nr:hypothetical protein SPRG_06164 [Saprolegnia parasitica CBS 223.65]KDO29108.1 hypothetical protein SPRG_06164 [Saprolegnia parasitica CBS 223.65]|eukprot:XP_012200274.1 hypothetical protein SPRG_06164 [Saprolegnia parasitica CBS 223.65]